MTLSPKSFYARPSSYTRISTVLILYVLIGFTGFIFGFVAISGQSLGYKCRSGKSRLVSVVGIEVAVELGMVLRCPMGIRKAQGYGFRWNSNWVCISGTAAIPAADLDASDQQGLQRSSLKAVGVAHNALVGSVVIWLMIKDALKSPGAVKCLQCEHKYHEACLKEHTYQEVASNTCFCGESCQEVYSGRQSRIRIVNLLSDGLSWTLLRCIHGDQRGTFCLNGCCFEGGMQLKAGC